MNKTLYYLFAPLCGWCYGATAAVAELLGVEGITLRLMPTGLFSDGGARPMDENFAAFAWTNDQRIAKLTGQFFTEQYCQRVLGDHQQLFDSGPATVALTAVSLTAPAQELQALKAIQHARYIDGCDVTSLTTLLAGLLQGLGLAQAAVRVMHADDELLAANKARKRAAQALMRECSAQGVPTLVAEAGDKRWLLDTSTAYSASSNPGARSSQLALV